MAPAHDGGVVVTDAGGNDLLRVGRHGAITPIAVFPVRPTPAPDGTVIRAMHFVPTTAARGRTAPTTSASSPGFPFPVGGARVWRVERGSAPTVYASGFTNIIDIAFDRRGACWCRRSPPTAYLPATRPVR